MLKNCLFNIYYYTVLLLTVFLLQAITIYAFTTNVFIGTFSIISTYINNRICKAHFFKIHMEQFMSYSLTNLQILTLDSLKYVYYSVIYNKNGKYYKNCYLKEIKTYFTMLLIAIQIFIIFNRNFCR